MDANQAEIVAALRDAGASVLCIHHVGHGAPDLIVGFGGRTVLMEVKSGLKDALTADEIDWHARWRGGALCVVRSVDEASGALGLSGGKESRP